MCRISDASQMTRSMSKSDIFAVYMQADTEVCVAGGIYLDTP